MLRSIGIENIRAFDEAQQAILAPITLIYGRNSSGKSTLLQSIMMLKQSHDASLSQRDAPPVLITNGPQADLGNFATLLPHHDLEKKFSISLAFDPVDQVIEPWRLRRGKPNGTRAVDFRFSWNSEFKIGVQDRFRLRLPEVEASFNRFSWNEPTAGTSRFVKTFRSATFALADDRSLKSLLNYLIEHMSADEKNTLHKIYGAQLPPPIFLSEGLFPDYLFVNRPNRSAAEPKAADLEVLFRGAFADLMQPVMTEFSSLMHRISYLGPFRRPSERLQRYSGAAAGHVGRHGEYATELLAQSPALTRAVNTWLTRLGMTYKIRSRVIRDATHGDTVRFTLQDSRTNDVVSLSDVGFGISQVLPVVVQSVFHRETLISIEQPEVHIHPALQADLADLLIDSALGEARNQLLVETHSENILLRIQRRIREKVIRPSDVSVVYVDQNESGIAKIYQIRLGEAGEFLDEWPTGFFEERVRELL